MKKILFLSLATLLFSCSDTEMAEKLKTMETEMTSLKAQLTEANKDKTYNPGLIHSVFFWLKEDLSEADEKAFLEGVNSLRKVESVKSCHIGPPAPTEARGVVDNSFSYALLVQFDDVAGQDAYQIAPIHLKFVEDHKDKWTKVIVYDSTHK